MCHHSGGDELPEGQLSHSPHPACILTLTFSTSNAPLSSSWYRPPFWNMPENVSRSRLP